LSRRFSLILVPAILLSAALTAICATGQPGPDWEEYKGWEIRSFKIEGLPKDLQGKLKDGLGQAGKWKLIGGMKRPNFTVTLLAEDLARIRLFMARNGYPAARVVPEVEAEAETKRLRLLLRVIPGDPVRYGRIDLEGWPEGVALPDTSDRGVLQVGQIVRDEGIDEALATIVRHLMDAGYATVEVETSLEPMGLGLVALVYRVTPGDFYVITEVEITGCSDDLLPVARRTMNVKPGVDYSQKLVNNAALDLRSTQLFSMVVIEAKPTGPGELKLIAHLENGRMKTLEAGVGTFTDNPWLVRAGWSHRNLFKNGVGFDVGGVFGTHRLGAAVGVNWLGFLSPRARSRVRVGYLGEDEDAYASQEFRLDLVQSLRPRKRDMLNFGTSLSHTDVDRRNPDARDVPESQGRLLEFWTDVKWDWTGEPLFPRDGGFFKVSATVAPPGLISEIPYVGFQLDSSIYRAPLYPVVFAARGRVGWSKPLGDAVEVLATRRFYAGGYNTHRGYGRRKLGPLDDAGDALGGEFVFLAGVETRFPLIWILEGALFVDAGQVYATPSDAKLSGTPVAVGADIDLRTPLGPVRAGYGWNVLNQVEGQPRHIFHFGIGYPW
jgi:outer membrane protein assembly factor BamA